MLLRLARHPQILFIVLNVAVNLLFLVRSYVTMQVLDYEALGVVTLVQSLILLVGIMQFGLVNGGYRLMCSADGADETRRINDAFYSGLSVLAGIAILAGIGAILFLDDYLYKLAGALGVAGGIAALVRSWIMNTLLAEGRLADYNRINTVSAVLSLGFLAFIPFDALIACLAALLMQHVLFVLHAFLSGKVAPPKSFNFDRALFARIFKAGFVLFLTGLFLQLNVQIERWYVLAALGLEALGHLYLVVLFITLFNLVPTSLQGIFLPPLIKAHDRDDAAQVGRGMAKMVLATIGYCAISALAVIVLAGPILSILLPRYLGDLTYVEIMLPGLLLFTAASALALPFNVLIEYRYYIVGYVAGTILLVAIFAAALFAGYRLSLEQVVAIRSASYAAMAAVLVFGFWRVVRRFPTFRPSLKGLLPRAGS